jgi:uncharacterized membrane protein YphA (DoxX/SURF4 family)
MQRRETLGYVVTIAVGALFVVSGLAKSLSFYGFLSSVRAYGLLPEALVVPFSFAVVAAELALGFLLMIDRWALPAAAALAWLVLLFLAAVVIALLQGRSADCGCFPGIGRETLGPWTLLRDSVLFLLLVGIVRWRALRGEGR